MTADRRLLLFDIDGTLITSGGAGEGALRDVLRTTFGVDETFSDISLAGRTDSAIAAMLLEKHNLSPTPEAIAALLDGYLHALRERIPTHPGRLLPGILPLLEELHKRPSVVLGLLTGNIVKGAEIKLTHYGVWDYFEFGAFADDHHDRNALGPVARARASEKHGEDFPPDRVFVIGDTPRDIECGKAFGAKTVAIATGQYTVEDLASHHPDFLFADLSDTQAVLAALCE